MKRVNNFHRHVILEEHSLQGEGTKLRVVALVNNPCITDSRVIREAEALARSGKDVLVLAHWSPDAREDETRNNVRYKRIAVRRAGRLTRSKVDGKLGRPAVRAAEKTAVNNSFVVRCIKSAVSIVVKRITRDVLTDTGLELLRHAHVYTKPAIDWQPDFVHAHDLYTLLAGYRIARKTGARLIYDSHELEFGRNKTFSKGELWLRAQCEAFLIRRSDAVITVSDSIADFLRNRYAIELPTVIFNAPSLGARDVNQTDIRSHLQLQPETPLAVFVGKLTTHRGIENCVRALIHEEGIHLACIGPRDEIVEKAILSEARRLGVSDRLHLVDSVQHHHVISFVSSADLSLITIQDVCLSYHYCFPNKLLESLMAGLPIVVSRLPELERMVARTGAGVVTDETDPVAIAQSMRQILSDRQAYIPTAEQIRKLQAMYGWQVQADKLQQLYERLGVRDDI